MPSATAKINGVLVAHSDETIVVEGNHYFPPAAVYKEGFGDSATKTRCGWKGEAAYYNVTLGGVTVQDAAWYYPKVTTEKAKPIENYIAFCKKTYDPEACSGTYLE